MLVKVCIVYIFVVCVFVFEIFKSSYLFLNHLALIMYNIHICVCAAELSKSRFTAFREERIH